MKRNVVITMLLVIAGIILAFVLFGAGAFWKGRSSPREPGASRAACASPLVATVAGQASAFIAYSENSSMSKS